MFIKYSKKKQFTVKIIAIFVSLSFLTSDMALAYPSTLEIKTRDNLQYSTYFGPNDVDASLIRLVGIMPAAQWVAKAKLAYPNNQISRRDLTDYLGRNTYFSKRRNLLSSIVSNMRLGSVHLYQIESVSSGKEQKGITRQVVQIPFQSINDGSLSLIRVFDKADFSFDSVTGNLTGIRNDKGGFEKVASSGFEPTEFFDGKETMIHITSLVNASREKELGIEGVSSEIVSSGTEEVHSELNRFIEVLSDNGLYESGEHIALLNKAYEFLLNELANPDAPITEDHLRLLNATFLYSKISNYRNEGTTLVDFDERIVATFDNQSQLSLLMKEFIDWLNAPQGKRKDPRASPALQKWIQNRDDWNIDWDEPAIHAALSLWLLHQVIHPFEDGNSRTSWTLMNALRKRNNLEAISLPTTPALHQYYFETFREDKDPRGLLAYLKNLMDAKEPYVASGAESIEDWEDLPRFEKMTKRKKHLDDYEGSQSKPKKPITKDRKREIAPERRFDILINELETPITASNHVYGPSPALTTFVASHFGDMTGQRAVDLGTGTGVMGFIMLEEGAAHVNFSDIKDLALNMAEENAEKLGYLIHDDRLAFTQSNIFNAHQDIRYGTVVFTPSPVDGYDISIGGKPETYRYVKHVRRFFDQVSSHLENRSRILFRHTVFPDRETSLQNSETIDNIVNRFAKEHNMLIAKVGPHLRKIESPFNEDRGRDASIYLEEHSILYVVLSQDERKKWVERLQALRSRRGRVFKGEELIDERTYDLIIRNLITHGYTLRDLSDDILDRNWQENPLANSAEWLLYMYLNEHQFELDTFMAEPMEQRERIVLIKDRLLAKLGEAEELLQSIPDLRVAVGLTDYLSRLHEARISVDLNLLEYLYRYIDPVLNFLKSYHPGTSANREISNIPMFHVFEEGRASTYAMLREIYPDEMPNTRDALYSLLYGQLSALERGNRAEVEMAINNLIKWTRLNWKKIEGRYVNPYFLVIDYLDARKSESPKPGPLMPFFRDPFVTYVLNLGPYKQEEILHRLERVAERELTATRKKEYALKLIDLIREHQSEAELIKEKEGAHVFFDGKRVIDVSTLPYQESRLSSGAEVTPATDTDIESIIALRRDNNHPHLAKQKLYQPEGVLEDEIHMIMQGKFPGTIVALKEKGAVVGYGVAKGAVYGSLSEIIIDKNYFNLDTAKSLIEELLQKYEEEYSPKQIHFYSPAPSKTLRDAIRDLGFVSLWRYGKAREFIKKFDHGTDTLLRERETIQLSRLSDYWDASGIYHDLEQYMDQHGEVTYSTGPFGTVGIRLEYELDEAMHKVHAMPTTIKDDFPVLDITGYSKRTGQWPRHNSFGQFVMEIQEYQGRPALLIHEQQPGDWYRALKDEDRRALDIWKRKGLKEIKDWAHSRGYFVFVAGPEALLSKHPHLDDMELLTNFIYPTDEATEWVEVPLIAQSNFFIDGDKRFIWYESAENKHVGTERPIAISGIGILSGGDKVRPVVGTKRAALQSLNLRPTGDLNADGIIREAIGQVDLDQNARTILNSQDISIQIVQNANQLASLERINDQWVIALSEYFFTQGALELNTELRDSTRILLSMQIEKLLDRIAIDNYVAEQNLHPALIEALLLFRSIKRSREKASRDRNRITAFRSLRISFDERPDIRGELNYRVANHAGSRMFFDMLKENLIENEISDVEIMANVTRHIFATSGRNQGSIYPESYRDQVVGKMGELIDHHEQIIEQISSGTEIAHDIRGEAANRLMRSWQNFVSEKGAFDMEKGTGFHGLRGRIHTYNDHIYGDHRYLPVFRVELFGNYDVKKWIEPHESQPAIAFKTYFDFHSIPEKNETVAAIHVIQPEGTGFVPSGYRGLTNPIKTTLDRVRKRAFDKFFEWADSENLPVIVVSPEGVVHSRIHLDGRYRSLATEDGVIYSAEDETKPLEPLTKERALELKMMEIVVNYLAPFQHFRGPEWEDRRLILQNSTKPDWYADTAPIVWYWRKPQKLSDAATISSGAEFSDERAGTLIDFEDQSSREIFNQMKNSLNSYLGSKENASFSFHGIKGYMKAVPRFNHSYNFSFIDIEVLADDIDNWQVSDDRKRSAKYELTAHTFDRGFGHVALSFYRFRDTREPFALVHVIQPFQGFLDMATGDAAFRRKMDPWRKHALEDVIGPWAEANNVPLYVVTEAGMDNARPELPRIAKVTNYRHASISNLWEDAFISIDDNDLPIPEGSRNEKGEAFFRRYIGRSVVSSGAEGVSKEEKIKQYRELEESWRKRLREEQGLGIEEPKWGEREATALFNGYFQLDHYTARKFYERVFKAGFVERIPASVRSDYILALNRIGYIRAAEREAEDVFKNWNSVIDSTSPSSALIKDEFFINAGTTYKNHYAARENLIQELKNIFQSVSGDQTNRQNSIEDYLSDKDKLFKLKKLVRYYLLYVARNNRKTYLQWFPSFDSGWGEILDAENVDIDALTRDLLQFTDLGIFKERMEFLNSRNKQDLEKALHYYRGAYKSGKSQYAGNNVIRMLNYLGGETNLKLAKALVPLVNQSALHSNVASYFWPTATLLEGILTTEHDGYEEDARALLPQLVKVGGQLPQARHSLIEHLERWVTLKRQRGDPTERVDFMQYVIDVLEGRETVPDFIDERNRMTQELDRVTYRLDKLNRIIVLENNLRYQGIVPPSIVSLSDIGFITEVLQSARTSDGRIVAELEDDKEIKDWVDQFIERVFRLRQEGERVFENITSEPHDHNFEKMLPGVIDFMGSSISGFGATNLSTMMLFGCADCRFSNYTAQTIIEVQQMLRSHAIIERELDRLLSGDADYVSDESLAKLNNLHRKDAVLMQATFNTNIALDNDELYKLSRDSDGNLILTEGETRDIESHTFTLHFERDAKGNIIKAKLYDVWYQEVYEMGDREIEDLSVFDDFDADNNREFTLPIRVMTRPSDPTNKFDTLDITFKVSRHSKPENILNVARYNASDMYFFGHRVEMPEDAASILYDETRHASWLQSMVRGFHESTILEDDPTVIDGVTRTRSEHLNRYPILEFFINGGRLVNPNGPRSSREVKDATQKRLADIAKARKDFFGPFREIWDLDLVASGAEYQPSGNYQADLKELSSRGLIDQRTTSILLSLTAEDEVILDIKKIFRHQIVQVSREDALSYFIDYVINDAYDNVLISGIVSKKPKQDIKPIQHKFDKTTSNMIESGEYNTNIFEVLVTLVSGEVADYWGNTQMISELAHNPDVVLIESVMIPQWMPSLHQLPEAMRQSGFDGYSERKKQIGDNIVYYSDDGNSDLPNMEIVHGTVRAFEQEVAKGPRNIGNGFGGRGLYVAQRQDKDVAEQFANMARNVLDTRLQHSDIVVRTSSDMRDGIVLIGRINPDKRLKIARFEMVQYGKPNLSQGKLPYNWDSDPVLRNVLENEFDVLEIVGTRRNQFALDTDRFFVFHERAGKDAIIWNESYKLDMYMSSGAESENPLYQRLRAWANPPSSFQGPFRYRTEDVSPFVNTDMIDALNELSIEDNVRFAVGVSAGDQYLYEFVAIPESEAAQLADEDVLARFGQDVEFRFISYIYPGFTGEGEVESYIGARDAVAHGRKITLTNADLLTGEAKRIDEATFVAPEDIRWYERFFLNRAISNIKRALKDPIVFESDEDKTIAKSIEDDFVLIGLMDDVLTLFSGSRATSYVAGVRNSRGRKVLQLSMPYIAFVNHRLLAERLKLGYKWHHTYQRLNEEHASLSQPERDMRIAQELNVFEKESSEKLDKYKTRAFYAKHFLFYVSARIISAIIKRQIKRQANILKSKIDGIKITEEQNTEEGQKVVETPFHAFSMIDLNPQTIVANPEYFKVAGGRDAVLPLEREAYDLAHRAMAIGDLSLEREIHQELITPLLVLLRLSDSGALPVHNYSTDIRSLLRSGNYNGLAKVMFDISEGLFPITRGFTWPLVGGEIEQIRFALTAANFEDLFTSTIARHRQKLNLDDPRYNEQIQLLADAERRILKYHGKIMGTVSSGSEVDSISPTGEWEDRRALDSASSGEESEPITLYASTSIDRLRGILSSKQYLSSRLGTRMSDKLIERATGSNQTTARHITDLDLKLDQMLSVENRSWLRLWGFVKRPSEMGRVERAMMGTKEDPEVTLVFDEKKEDVIRPPNIWKSYLTQPAARFVPNKSGKSLSEFKEIIIHTDRAYEEFKDIARDNPDTRLEGSYLIIYDNEKEHRILITREDPSIYVEPIEAALRAVQVTSVIGLGIAAMVLAPLHGFAEISSLAIPSFITGLSVWILVLNSFDMGWFKAFIRIAKFKKAHKHDKVSSGAEEEFTIKTDEKFIFEGAEIEQQRFPIPFHQNKIFPVITVNINGAQYKVGGEHYLQITFANGKRAYWGGQHNFSYSYFYDYYQDDVQTIIDSGGVPWRHLDYHTDFGSYGEAAFNRKKDVLWEDEREAGTMELTEANYLGYSLTTGIVRDLYRVSKIDEEVSEKTINNHVTGRILGAIQLSRQRVIGGVYDLDMDILTNGNPAIELDGALANYVQMEPHLAKAAETSDVIFVTNSSELSKQYRGVPLYMNPRVSVRIGGLFIAKLARDALNSGWTPTPLSSGAETDPSSGGIDGDIINEFLTIMPGLNSDHLRAFLATDPRYREAYEMGWSNDLLYRYLKEITANGYFPHDIKVELVNWPDGAAVLAIDGKKSLLSINLANRRFSPKSVIKSGPYLAAHESVHGVLDKNGLSFVDIVQDPTSQNARALNELLTEMADEIFLLLPKGEDVDVVFEKQRIVTNLIETIVDATAASVFRDRVSNGFVDFIRERWRNIELYPNSYISLVYRGVVSEEYAANLPLIGGQERELQEIARHHHDMALEKIDNTDNHKKIYERLRAIYKKFYREDPLGIKQRIASGTAYQDPVSSGQESEIDITSASAISQTGLVDSLLENLEFKKGGAVDRLLSVARISYFQRFLSGLDEETRQKLMRKLLDSTRTTGSMYRSVVATALLFEHMGEENFVNGLDEIDVLISMTVFYLEHDRDIDVFQDPAGKWFPKSSGELSDDLRALRDGVLPDSVTLSSDTMFIGMKEALLKTIDSLDDGEALLISVDQDPLNWKAPYKLFESALQKLLAENKIEDKVILVPRNYKAVSYRNVLRDAERQAENRGVKINKAVIVTETSALTDRVRRDISHELGNIDHVIAATDYALFQKLNISWMPGILTVMEAAMQYLMDKNISFNIEVPLVDNVDIQMTNGILLVRLNPEVKSQEVLKLHTAERLQLIAA